jgi:hypothetical protein
MDPEKSRVATTRSLGVVLGLALGVACVASACSSSSGSPSSASNADAAVPTDAGLSPLESSPPQGITPSARLDCVSSTVVFDRLRGGVWTANGDVGTASYVDVTRGQVVHEIAIGQEVTSVALSPDFTWLAAVDHTGASVSLVDATRAEVKRTIALGTHPRAAVWDASDPRWLYVSLEDDGAIAVVDRTLGVLDHTVPVGRLPAGLAVSRTRRELVVARRIDPDVTILPLDGAYAPADQGVPAVDIGLAYQTPVPDDTQPSGLPFAQQSVAWAIDGQTLWVPHELLANHHPFQFQRNLFPAVSVVDVAGRAEVQTNPNDPNGVIAGRKLLFGAINIPDAMGNTSVVSQPCAAALHPNGLAAYVVACGSQDLLTFDLTAGIAVDLLRALPGNHPTGMTLDDTGARLFVVSDQSHTLLTLDTAGGSLLGHVAVVGKPVTVVAKDPVDPQLRAGYTLFYNAQSSLFPYATTGNDWMSCGGCHLDGFVSTNAVFFEALTPLDPTSDARIGHDALKDLFSTAPTPTSAQFQPHDILAALLDQGGLAPDRTGQVRTGQIDPDAPPADAVTMAQQLAQVIAKTLPIGPAWLLPGSPKPDTSYDTSWCGNCHPSEYKAWQQSAHAHAGADVMVKYGSTVEQQLVGTQYSRQCAGCHDPVSARLGDTSLTSGRGITCLGCHDVTRLIRAGGNSDMEAAPHDWTQDHVVRAKASLETLKTPDFCAVCHQQFVPGNGILGITTLTEWQQGPFSPGTACVDCHVPDVGQGVHDHSMPGGNVYVAQQFGETAFAQTVAAKLASAIQLQAFSAHDGIHVVVQNVGSGHAFPTGVTDIREPWVEAQAIDTNGNVVQSYGGPDSTGLVPASAARLGMDIAAADGGVLLKHELTEATSIPFYQAVPSGSAIEVVIPVPETPPTGAVGFQAVLYYRNVRTTYYRDATGDATGSAPTVQVAKVAVSL